jgi:hypothetical protein
MYRVSLTAEQLSALNRLCHDKDTKPKTRTRLEMVRLSDAGWAIPQIPSISTSPKAERDAG